MDAITKAQEMQQIRADIQRLQARLNEMEEENLASTLSSVEDGIACKEVSGIGMWSAYGRTVDQFRRITQKVCITFEGPPLGDKRVLFELESKAESAEKPRSYVTMISFEDNSESIHHMTGQYSWFYPERPNAPAIAELEKWVGENFGESASRVKICLAVLIAKLPAVGIRW